VKENVAPSFGRPSAQIRPLTEGFLLEEDRIVGCFWKVEAVFIHRAVSTADATRSQPERRRYGAELIPEINIIRVKIIDAKKLNVLLKALCVWPSVNIRYSR
jgi:hypothetical protein